MTALFTGDQTKAKALAKRCAVSRSYDYDDYQAVKSKELVGAAAPGGS
ncbi:MAG TPA: hypothetical protein VK673_00695 [Chthoniobacterales bacterium]|nr:hypothetical protein [Chthoniobacterales bacterium]